MIRQATKNDLQQILEIYESAKHFMHTHGNPNQWNGAYPEEKLLCCDIEKGYLYVMTDDKDNPYAVFALIEGKDPTYGDIDGEWLTDTPYATIHRIAGDGTRQGIMRECFEFSSQKYDHLRVDTHEDNKPMQRAVTNCGFVYTGIIYLDDGSPRKAYEWVKKNSCNQ